MSKIKLAFIIFSIISGFLLCFFIMSTTILLSWKSGGEFINYPPSHISLTAEYLYDNPSPLPYEIHTSYNHVDNFDKLCVEFRESDTGGPYLIWARWFLNGALIPSELYTVDTFQSLNTKALISYCLELTGDTILLNGIHLFEIRLQNSPFDVGHSYQWAIKIEPTGIPTPSATPSAP